MVAESVDGGRGGRPAREALPGPSPRPARGLSSAGGGYIFERGLAGARMLRKVVPSGRVVASRLFLNRRQPCRLAETERRFQTDRDNAEVGRHWVHASHTAALR